MCNLYSLRADPEDQSRRIDAARPERGDLKPDAAFSWRRKFPRMGWAMKCAIIPMVLAISLFGVVRPSPAAARPSVKFSSVIAGKSIQCGAGSAMYFSPTMRTASVIDGVDEHLTVGEFETALDPARITVDDANRFDIVLTTRDGETRFRFERRNGIFLRGADGEGGDACTASTGRASYVRARYDIIREGVCGNDPKPSCEKALANRCGPQPTPSCVKSFDSRRYRGR